MALAIRRDLLVAEPRRYARRAPTPRAAARALALAHALDGMSRAVVARLAGMEHQALRDAVVRSNAEGLAGLFNRPKPGQPPGLTEGEEATLRARLLRGPDPERDGLSSYTRTDIAVLIERHLDIGAQRLRQGSVGWAEHQHRTRFRCASRLPIAAPGWLRDGIAPCLGPQQQGEVHLDASLDQRGCDHATGTPLPQVRLDLRQHTAAMGGVHTGREMARAGQRADRGEKLAGMGTLVDDAQRLRHRCEARASAASSCSPSARTRTRRSAAKRRGRSGASSVTVRKPPVNDRSGSPGRSVRAGWVAVHNTTELP
jgi:transposase